MSAADSAYDLQRAQGELRIAYRDRAGTTALADLRQQGCLKARFPRPVDWPEAVLLNSSGGVAGGDHLAIDLDVGQGARATFTAQAAERFYRARTADRPAHVRTTLTVGPAAAAEWLPQESILFNACALHRELQVDLAADAWFLGVEALVFGRALMGETVRTARLADTIRIRQGGKLVLHDAIRLDGDVAAVLAASASAGGAHAMATIIHAAPNAPAMLAPLREAWADAPAQAAASAWHHLLVGRIVAPDSAALRTTLTAALDILRNGRKLPRVWNC